MTSAWQLHDKHVTSPWWSSRVVCHRCLSIMGSTLSPHCKCEVMSLLPGLSQFKFWRRWLYCWSSQLKSWSRWWFPLTDGYNPAFTYEPATPLQRIAFTPAVLNDSVRTGAGNPGKSWNFTLPFSRTGKSWKMNTSPGKSWRSVSSALTMWFLLSQLCVARHVKLIQRANSLFIIDVATG